MIPFPPAPPTSGEFRLGVPVPFPLSDPVRSQSTADLETLIRDAFNWGNKMIVITRDGRGLYQTSMKRQDGDSFAVEVDADVIRSIRGALSILKL